MFAHKPYRVLQPFLRQTTGAMPNLQMPCHVTPVHISCTDFMTCLYDLRYIVQSDRMMPTMMRIRWTNLSLCWPLGYKFAPCTVYVRSKLWRAPPALNARGCQSVLAIVASRTLHNDLGLSHDLAFPRGFLIEVLRSLTQLDFGSKTQALGDYWGREKSQDLLAGSLSCGAVAVVLRRSCWRFVFCCWSAGSQWIPCAPSAPSGPSS